MAEFGARFGAYLNFDQCLYQMIVFIVLKSLVKDFLGLDIIIFTPQLCLKEAAEENHQH